jgi:hypothetical protein
LSDYIINSSLRVTFGNVAAMKIFKWSAGLKNISLKLSLSVAGSAMLLCLTGCASVPKPPSQFPAWTHVDKKAGNPIISGSYQDTGSGFSKDGKFLGQFSLTRLLQTAEPYSTTNNDIVVVIGPANGTLEVQTWSDHQLVSTIERTYCTTLTRSNYRTTYNNSGGFVWLPYELSTEAGPFLLLFENYECSLVLRKAKDGSLIIYERDVGTGEIFFVPFYQNHSKWYRFKPIAATAGNATNAPAKANN